MHYWPLLILALLCCYIVVRMFAKNHKETISAWQLKVPLYGKLLLKSELARLCASIALSLENGIQLLRAIELALPVLHNEVLRQEVAKAYEGVKQGESFGKHLRRSGHFPVFMTNLVVVGEESGKLAPMLGEVAEYFQKDTDEALKIMASQFEPVLILVIGVILGYMVIAMLLPILQINLIAG